MARFLIAVAVFCSLACTSLAFPKKPEGEGGLQLLPTGNNPVNSKFFFPIMPGWLPWIPINIPTRPPPAEDKEEDKKEEDKEEDNKKEDEKDEDEKKEEEGDEDKEGDEGTEGDE